MSIVKKYLVYFFIIIFIIICLELLLRIYSNFSNVKKKIFLPSWKDITWLKKKINGKPLIVKGVVDPNDAKKAFLYGADGLWVSNHGGRAFESNLSSLEMLPKIRKKVGKNKFKDDQIRISLNDLAFPATTDAKKLSEKIQNADRSKMIVYKIMDTNTN